MFGLLFLVSSSIAADPQFTKLKEGDIAPWDGRLFNDAAVAKFIVEDRLKVDQCEIQTSYSLEILNAELDLKHKKELLSLNTDITILEQKVSLRNDRITALESLKTPPNPFWYTTAGFLLGSAVTIAITYSVNQ
jgi:hypothetical protein|tara:strand:- start:10417 stop:10818 length:402 start_codon:yes stop_codon:yes gene_type:complete